MTLVRIFLTIALLTLCWQHAHWSVALLLTLICIGREVDGLIFSAVIKAQAAKQNRTREFIERLRSGKNETDQSN